MLTAFTILFKPTLNLLLNACKILVFLIKNNEGKFSVLPRCIAKQWFRYDKILHTKNPNTSLLAPLLEADKITVDLAAHYNPDGKWRDHGMLFKMLPIDLPLLLGDPIEYDLTHP